ncbi:Uncharacterised protein [Prevotella pallens]|uniref:Uncharacterized protein n=1 Tax=Prevotella pallens TaxID=60133 RepID=A0A379GA05_9BACT|nr:Uncharacterised protein [Prevotella pallens]
MFYSLLFYFLDINTTVSTPMVMGNISTLVDGNISKIGSRL